MRIDQLGPAPGARRERRRVGRGHGSGRGTTAGRGTKGQKARSGGQIDPRFEGGQLRLVQRLPYKRGFKNIFRIEYAIVNLAMLAEKFASAAVITPQEMVEAGLIKSTRRPVKVLGDGEIDKPLVVRAQRFSRPAREKILAAGGQVEEIAHAATAGRS